MPVRIHRGYTGSSPHNNFSIYNTLGTAEAGISIYVSSLWHGRSIATRMWLTRCCGRPRKGSRFRDVVRIPAVSDYNRLQINQMPHIPVEKAVEAFFKRYDSTLQLLQQFLAARANRQEFVLLSCARLDSLANLAFAEGPQRSRFSRFLSKYSGLGKDTFAVSVPDLYYFFQHYHWIAHASVPEPGRIMLFRERDKEFAQFVYESGVPITVSHVRKLLASIMSSLEGKFRIFPRQRIGKKTSATNDAIVTVIADAVMGNRSAHYQPDFTAIKAIVSSYTIGTLLYRRYRSAAIHEWGAELDEREFFSKTIVYWKVARVHSHRFLKIQFPAGLLLDCLKRAIIAYKCELQETHRLPYPIWTDSRLSEEFLDRRSIFSDTPVKLRIQ